MKRMRVRARTALLILAGTGFVAACSSSQPQSSSTAGGASEDGTASVLAATIPAIPGPKRVVAVGGFESIGAFRQKYGEWDIGGGLAAMLATALVESGQFIVVERANLGQILSEQELQATGVAVSGTGPKLGQLSGAQLLVFGAVTEFGAEDSGGGLGLGLSSFSFGGGGFGFGGFGFGRDDDDDLVSAGVSRQTTEGTIAMDVRLVDATTGRVVRTETIRETVEGEAYDLSVGFNAISVGTNRFLKTPLGEAARKVITRAVQRIADAARAMPWRGQVVKYDGVRLFLNAGSREGVRSGDRFTVERIVERLTDPATGEVLHVRKVPLGSVTVVNVQEKLSFGPYEPVRAEKPGRGDLVVVASPR